MSLIRAQGTFEAGESPRASASRIRGRVQGALLIGQIAAALTLLTGAGLLAKELLRLEHEGFGFDPTNVACFQSCGDQLEQAQFNSVTTSCSGSAGFPA